MKTMMEVRTQLFATLAELQSGTTLSNPGLDTQLRTQLEVLYDILGDDVDEEYWEQIENEIALDGIRDQVQEEIRICVDQTGEVPSVDEVIESVKMNYPNLRCWDWVGALINEMQKEVTK